MAQAKPVQRYRQGYSYCDLGRLSSIGAEDAKVTYDVWGVVVRIHPPKKARAGTGDYYRQLDITDPSTGDLRVQLLCFDADQASLPELKRPGDIIRLHRITTQWYEGQFQLTAGTSRTGRFNRIRSAYCLFDGQPDDANAPEACRPYQSSSDTYHWNDAEAEMLAAIRAWVALGDWKHFLSNTEQELINARRPDPYRRWMRELFEEGVPTGNQHLIFRDVEGIVLGIDRDVYPEGALTEGELQRRGVKKHSEPPLHAPAVLFIWDGSDARPFSPQVDTRPRCVMEDGLFTQNQQLKGGETQEESATEKFPHSKLLRSLHRCDFQMLALSPHLAATMPAYGTALPVVFVPRPDGLQLPRIGSCVRLRNCGFHIIDGQVQGYFHLKSKWYEAVAKSTEEPVEDVLIQRHEHRLQHGEVSSFAPLDRRSFAAETLHAHRSRPLTSLRQVAALAAQGKSGIYRCLVRVLRVWPDTEEVSGWCIRAGDAARAAAAEGLHSQEWTYALRMLVEDGSAALLVDLFGEDGRRFFADVAPPQDLLAVPYLMSLLRTTMQSLMDDHTAGSARDNGADGGGNGVPARWLEIALKAYKIPGPDERHEYRFRVFDTTLKTH